MIDNDIDNTLQGLMEGEANLNIDGQKVRRLREKNKLTQLYLATVVGVTTDTISRWENKRYPSVKRENALKLAEALEVSLEELIELPPEEEVEFAQIQEQPAAAPQELASTGRRPLLWALALALIIVSCFMGWRHFGAAKSATFSAIRFLPGHVLVGQPFPVLVEIESDQAKPTTLMLREALPENCTPLSAIPPFTAQDNQGKRIKWINKIDSSKRASVVYLVQADKDATLGENLRFEGNLVIGRRGGYEPKVLGAQTAEVSTFHWADVNRVQRIDDY